MRDCLFRSLVVLLGGAFLAATAATTSARADNDIHIITLSSRPDTVSGGNVLVRVDFPPGSSTVNVLLNGQAVTGAFRPVGRGGARFGRPPRPPPAEDKPPPPRPPRPRAPDDPRRRR